MSLSIPFENRYTKLPAQLYQHVLPDVPPKPELIIFNTALAEALGIDSEGVSEAELAEVFSGAKIPFGADPIATAYAGHQFGNWNPGLGDGRAVLLGDARARDGHYYDLMLKGSGRTAFSRGGDGKAWIGPVLREYLVSEAMHAMGIPTTRALAAARTGETVYREAEMPGAVLTRVAASHLRVGTFQRAAAMQDLEGLEALYKEAVERHYPDATSPAALLHAVVERQAKLIAKWMSVGFIHGVMNTDNMAISGETIDYGPCAFVDAYNPDQVFSSIDRQGRYRYRNQPRIAPWNLAQFASALLPLTADIDKSVAEFTAIIEGFEQIYAREWAHVLAQKLGLQARPETTELGETLLDLMAEYGRDFTQTFDALTHGAPLSDAPIPALEVWKQAWHAAGPNREAMKRANPAVIPRNHQIEAVIAAAVAGDDAPFHTMLEVITHPYRRDAAAAPFMEAPEESEKVYQTFCGT